MRHRLLPVHLAVSVLALASSGCSAGADAPSTSQPGSLSSGVHYITKVVSYTPGDGGGFGKDKLPAVVFGPPQGGGCCAGSVDVVSLGNGGEIVVGFDVEIVDGPGVDLLVFENAFRIAGDPDNVLAEPAEVAVSEDGTTWTAFPCTAKSAPYGTCAGWHPVLATRETGVDANDPDKAGGDPFDLATIGVARARYVRIRDMNGRFPAKDGTAGFDLDAIAVLHSTP